jgi:hypothetical protein
MKQRPYCKANSYSASHDISLTIRNSIFINVFTAARNSVLFGDVSRQHVFKTHFTLHSYLYLGPSCPFPSSIQTKISNEILFSSTKANDLSLLISLVLLSWHCLVSSKIHEFPHYVVFFSIADPNIFLSSISPNSSSLQDFFYYKRSSITHVYNNR